MQCCPLMGFCVTRFGTNNLRMQVEKTNAGIGQIPNPPWEKRYQQWSATVMTVEEIWKIILIQQRCRFSFIGKDLFNVTTQHLHCSFWLVHSKTSVCFVCRQCASVFQIIADAKYIPAWCHKLIRFADRQVVIFGLQSRNICGSHTLENVAVI